MTKTLIIAFGSQVSGRTRSGSDFDFAVYSDKPMSLSDHTEISYSLSEKFNINEDKIDLVDLQTASPLLKFEIAKKAN
ncbi:MAG TPA: nucleotidyltransferase domain-containing protein [Candidatus Paceibacterota bacterium]